MKNSKKYRTTAGRFTSRHADLPYYTFGIQNARLSEKQVILIASPEKVICDKIVMTSWIPDAPKRESLKMLTKALSTYDSRLVERI